MKKLTFTLALMMAVILGISQPSAFYYQTVVRDANGDVLSSQTVSFEISILQGSPSGTNVYTETHTAITNQFGLVNLKIGNGTVVSGDFGEIEWGGDTFFLQIKLDENGGANYQFMGVSQLLSVPVSLYSERSKSTDQIKVMTDSAFVNIENPLDGMIVFNKDDNKLYIYNGLSWRVFKDSDCYPLPSEAYAGDDQYLYDTTMTTLNANQPEVGEGKWMIMSGSGGTIEDDSNPNSIFSGLLGEAYNLTWSVSNVCDSTYDSVTIEFIEYVNPDTAFFVSASLGSDANPGTIDAPFYSVSHAIAMVQASEKKKVYVMEGNYNENIVLCNSVKITGGYNSVWEWGSSYKTYLNVPSSGVQANNISDVTLKWLTIISNDADVNNISSYGVYLNNSQGIEIINCEIYSGDGYNGEDGIAGSNGSSGQDGQPGQPGCENGDLGCETCDEPVGGVGAYSSFGSYGGNGGAPGYGIANGSSGEDGGGIQGGTGGLGGDLDNSSSCSSSIIPGYIANGINGSNGMYGDNGAGGTSFGSIMVYGYAATNNGGDGTPGENGSGGGGGGGGKGGVNGCYSYGSSGGGGGSGGEGGTNGSGGAAGGGSFGIWVFNSNASVESCLISTGNGGNGGAGGVGGIGGAGGNGGQSGTYGGTGQDDAGCGGWGGNGGQGGNGGHGGGGGGGPSIGIVKSSNSVVNTNGVAFQIGYGGQGGFSNGISGQNGVAMNKNY